MKKTTTLGLTAALALIAAPFANAASLDEKIDAALAFAEVQIENLARLNPRLYPCYTFTDGSWNDRGVAVQHPHQAGGEATAPSVQVSPYPFARGVGVAREPAGPR